MLNYLKDLKKLLGQSDDREWHFKAHAGPIKRTFRAFKYCFLGGYSGTGLTGSEFISLQQLENEKHVLMKFIPEVEFERFENLYFGLGTRIKSAIFISLFVPVSIFNLRLARSLEAFSISQRLSFANENRTFIYYAFLQEVYLALWLCHQKGIKICYLELANFLDDNMKVSTAKLITISNIGHDFIQESANFNVDQVSSYIKKPQIIQRIDQNADQSKSKAKRVGFYTSGYFARIKFDSHSKEFLAECESEEIEIIRMLSDLVPSAKNRLIICPHYFRGVENYAESKSYYASKLNLAADKSVTISPTTQSPRDFDLVLTHASNVFFDALFQGKKAFIIGGQRSYQTFLKSSAMGRFHVPINRLNGQLLTELMETSDFEFLTDRLGT